MKHPLMAVAVVGGAAALIWFTRKAEAKPFVYGDVDMDGVVTEHDRILVRRYDAKLIELTPEQLERADVNGDGVVDIVDALIIGRYLEGLIDKFPVEG